MKSRNDFKGLIRSGRLMEIAHELTEEQGGIPPTFRSAIYRLLDYEEIRLSEEAKKPMDTLYKAFNASLENERLQGNFEYGVFSDDAGTDYVGLSLFRLEQYIENLRENNTPPILIDSMLKIVLVEKAGLVDLMIQLTGGQIPVASPGGMIRKEWAWGWLKRMKNLLIDLDGSMLSVCYLGDRDDGGDRIQENLIWYKWAAMDMDMSIIISIYAVTTDQLKSLNDSHNKDFKELHLDGYIAMIGPREFGNGLRTYLGLD